MWGKDHAVALKEVFETLNSNSINWMVLRNYEGLPQENRSKDIDLLLEKKDFKQVQEVLSETLKMQGFDRLLKETFQYVWCLTFFKTINYRIISIKIDLLDGFVWKGAQLMHFSELYKNKVPYNNFHVPSQIDDGFMLWMKPLLTGGFIKEKYREDILNTIDKHPKEFQQLLIATFGEKKAKKAWMYLEEEELDKTIPMQKELCHAAWLKEFKKNSIMTVFSTIEHYYKEILRRSVRPKGSFVSVAGPDGVGKSTFIELLEKELAECFVKDDHDIHVVHFRPKIIPNLKKLFGGKKYDESKEEFTNPHRAKPVGGLNAFARITYYWLDYVLGYWLNTRRKCANGKIYIFDRYFYDFIIDPFRSRINLPEWVRLMYWKATPKTDLIFFLECDAETIYKRKQELTQEEIERQLKRYRALADSSSRFVILNACETPEQVCQQAVQSIVEISSERL